GLAVLWLGTRGAAWRLVYANLFGAAAMYMVSSLMINVAIGQGKYKTGSVYDIPLIASFLWYATAGLIAYRKEKELDAPADSTDSDAKQQRTETTWTTRVAMAAVCSLPFFAIYAMKFSEDSREVRDFRVFATVIAAVPIGLLVFLRQHLADKEHVRLLEQSEHSIDNLQRLQTQLVQSEKLISLGQL